MITIPFFITLYAGFSHAFETDHLLAVGNIVTRRNHIHLSLKDGIYWGLGHTSTILLVGLLMLVLRLHINEIQFSYFEAAVGFMLMLLGVMRIIRYYSDRDINTVSSHHHGFDNSHQHGLAYSVGLVHGLAGSGVLMVLVMSEMQDALQGLGFLLIFGFGSLAGMALAASIFSIPFTKKFLRIKNLQALLLWLSCVLCLVYGGKVFYENLFA